MLLGTVILGFCISIWGITTNALSLYFYIHKSDKSMAIKLLILLNAWDLAVCTSVAGMQYASYSVNCDTKDCTRNREGMYFVAYAYSVICFEGSAFSSVLLSVSRAIQVSQPFYRVKGKAIAVSFLLFLSIIALRETVDTVFMFTLPHPLRVIYFVILGMEHVLIYLAVGVSNAISVVTLLKGDGVAGSGRVPETSKKATITVFMLSVSFLVANIVCDVSVFITYLVVENYFTPAAATLHFAIWIVIPLNSSLNPVVYFVRNRELREYSRGVVWRVMCRSDGQ